MCVYVCVCVEFKRTVDDDVYRTNGLLESGSVRPTLPLNSFRPSGFAPALFPPRWFPFPVLARCLRVPGFDGLSFRTSFDLESTPYGSTPQCRPLGSGFLLCFSFDSVRYSIGSCFSFGSRLQVPECAEEKDGDDDGRGGEGGQRGGATRGRHRI